MLKLQYFDYLLQKSQLIGKDPDAGSFDWRQDFFFDWRQKKKGEAENEMVR